jgi:hypothetical protein
MWQLWTARQATPLVRALAKHSILTIGFDGQSSNVAFLVMNAGPARNASATLSLSLVGRCLGI